MPSPLRILFVASDRQDGDLALTRELDSIRAAFAPAIAAGRVRLEDLRRPDPDALIDVIASFKPHIFHFSGLDNGAGAPCLAPPGEDGSDAGVVLSIDPLRDTLATAARHLRCVVLNTSRSAPLADKLIPQVPFAVGMRDDITVETACKFSHCFYLAISAGASLYSAVHITNTRLAAQSRKNAGLLHHNADSGRSPDEFCLLPCEDDATAGDSATHTERTTRILVIACLPPERPTISLREELNAMQRRLQATAHATRFHIVQLWNPTFDTLIQQISTHEPDVIHFSGHASEHGEPLLVDANGRGKPLKLASLRPVLAHAAANSHLVCVVFNMGNSAGIAAELPTPLLGIGMASDIPDPEACLFTENLYDALFAGQSVLTAFESARHALARDDGDIDNYFDVPRLHGAADSTRTFLISPGHRGPPAPFRRPAEPSLATVLLDMFSPEEFKLFLQTSISDMVDKLGPLTPADQFFSATVDLLARHGAIDPAFFDFLLAARPRQADKIRAARDRWLALQSDRLTR